jgi:hypothetical protein
VAIQEIGGDQIVPVGKDVSFDLDTLADRSLGREAARVDLRLHRFDYDPQGGQRLALAGGGLRRGSWTGHQWDLCGSKHSGGLRI